MARVVPDGQLAEGDDRLGKYPFDLWADGRTWEIEHGEDFDVRVSTMRTYLYDYAAMRGMKVNTKLPPSNPKAIRFVFTHDLDSVPAAVPSPRSRAMSDPLSDD